MNVKLLTIKNRYHNIFVEKIGYFLKYLKIKQKIVYNNCAMLSKRRTTYYFASLLTGRTFPRRIFYETFGKGEL